MQKKKVISFAVLASLIPLLILGLDVVDAAGTNITGQVKSGGSGLDDAKVTAEKANEYQYARTNVLGNFDVATTTSSAYTVDSSKTAYARDRELVFGGGTSPDHVIGTRLLTDVKFKVAYDDTNSITLASAKSTLLTGEPWFREEHSIDFIETTASYEWDTSDASATCASLLSDMVDDADWPNTTNGADMLFGYSAKSGMTGSKACGFFSGSYASNPAFVVTSVSPDHARSVMHEISHAYGLDETDTTCTSQVPNIMATDPNGGACSSQYIKNWNPTQDDHMNSHRSDW